jgi:streptogramin lyase
MPAFCSFRLMASNGLMATLVALSAGAVGRSCDAAEAIPTQNSAAKEQVTTIAGNGQDGYGGSSGKATDIPVSQPFGLVIGPDQALYVCEVGTHVVRRIDLTTGQSAVVAGCGRKGYSGDGGPATAAELNEPYEIRFDQDGNLFFVEMQNHLVRRVDAKSGVISTVAGTGRMGFGGDGGLATQALMNRPHSIAFDADGRLYICDIGNHRIRRVQLSTGIITTFAGTGERQPTPDGAPIDGTPLNGPRALDFDGRHSLYLALREGNAIYRLDLQSARIQHLAGTGKSGYSGDGGPARTALLSGPKGISLAPNGDVYFADTESHTVRVIRMAGNADQSRVETVVGDGSKGNGPSGDPDHCRMDRPHGVFVSSDHVLYIGDSNNHQVRRIRLTN